MRKLKGNLRQKVDGDAKSEGVQRRGGPRIWVDGLLERRNMSTLKVK